MRFLFVFTALAAVPALVAQIGSPWPGGGGQYPGSPWPGGQDPNGPGLPLPWPHKRGPAGAGQSPAQVSTRTRGTLKRLDDKHILVDAADGRELDFHRTSSTRFYRGAKEIDAAQFHPGDEISVEASEDRQGYLIARSVYFEQAGAPAAESSAPAAPAAPEAPGTTDAPPPARDPDDPGPPVLRRGIPADRDTVNPAGGEDESSSAAAPAAPTVADALIAKARNAAAAYAAGLPDYVCTEYMARYDSDSRPADWQPLDVVSTDVVFRQGHESYRDVAVNGKAVHKRIEALDGSWSTGEFASTLLDLFSPSTAAVFRFREDSDSSGVPARVYDFTVERSHSHWRVQAPSQTLRPAYKGSVWIEPKTGHVLRIEMQARDLPGEFPLDTVESAVDFQQVRIGEGQFFLPVHAESLACQRGSADCSLNKIDFRNYHKYEANSSITFSQ